MNVTLYDDLILVRLLPMEKVSEGGIIIPDTADNTNKKATGIVIEHGEGKMDMGTGIRQPITVKKGDKVSFTFGRGTPMEELLEEDLLLMRECDLDFIIIEYEYLGIELELHSEIKELHLEGSMDNIAFILPKEGKILKK